MRDYSVKKTSHRTNRICRAIKNFLIGSVIFVSFVGCTGFAVSEGETKYRLDGVVDSVMGDEITIQDSTGNLWVIFGDSFEVGEKVRVTFFTNFTNYTREDDEVIKIKKINNKATK